MLCENCKKSPANVHLTEILDGARRELHLCERCAQENGFAIGTQPITPASMLGKLAESFQEMVTGGLLPASELSCEDCGLSFAEFRQEGRLGCAGCYEAFGDELAEIIEKVHDAAEHTGKFPSRGAPLLKRRSERRKLQRELDDAVRVEDYERAAVLRDQIHSLDADLEQDA